MAERLLIQLNPWMKWREKKLKSYISTGQVVNLSINEEIECIDRIIILIKGEAIENGEAVLSAPTLVKGGTLKAIIDSKLFLLRFTKKLY
jgi:hypothetical protein